MIVRRISISFSSTFNGPLQLEQMPASYSNDMNKFLGYAERERVRGDEAARINKAQGMLWEDFKDRLHLFISDLSQWLEGSNLDYRLHASTYFNHQEIRKLASVSRLCDSKATPEEMKQSLELLIPLFRFKIEGVWHYPSTRYIDWLKNEKECIPGSFRGVYADVLAEILPEEDQREREEIREAEKKAAADKAKAKRRKASRERKLKAEEEHGKTNSEEEESYDLITEAAPFNKNRKRKLSGIHK